MDKQIENRHSQYISRCDVRVYGNGRSRAVAWVLVVSQVFVRALCSWLSVWQCCLAGTDLFLGRGYFILHLYKGPGEKYSSSVWFYIPVSWFQERASSQDTGGRPAWSPSTHISLHLCCDMYVHTYFWLHLLSVHVSHKQTYFMCQNVIQQRVFILFIFLFYFGS